MHIDLVPIVGIVCGTGMITIVCVSIAWAISRARSSRSLDMMENILDRLEALEARSAAQGNDMRQLQDQAVFLDRLLKDERRGGE